MFTEAELRDALRHSAARADDLTVPEPASDAGATVHPIAAPRASTPAARRRRFVPVAAAAAVMALAVTSVLVLRDDRQAGQPVDTASEAASQSASAAATGPQSGPPQFVDLVQASAPGVINHEIRRADDGLLGAQTLRRYLGPVNAMALVVVPAANVDANRIPRDRPVPIGSTTGYYSLFKLFPLDANTGPGSDKWLPQWTIAFTTPAGDWAFASIEKAMSTDDPDPADSSVDDPAMIAAEYANLGVTFTPNESRLPFRFGYLPAGLQFHNASYDTGVDAPGYSGIFVGNDTQLVDVQLLDSAFGGGLGHCVSDRTAPAGPLANGETPASEGGLCGYTVQRDLGPRILQVHVRGYDAAEAQRILDAMVAAPDLADRSTYFTLAEVLG